MLTIQQGLTKFSLVLLRQHNTQQQLHLSPRLCLLPRDNWLSRKLWIGIAKYHVHSLLLLTIGTQLVCCVDPTYRAVYTLYLIVSVIIGYRCQLQRIPICLVYGKEDPWVRPVWGMKVKQQFPEAPYYEISPAGHCPHDEVPQVFKDLHFHLHDSIISNCTLIYNVSCK